MNALARIAAIARVEWTRLFRTRIAVTLLLVVPVLQIVLFGYAIRPDAAVTVAIAAPTPENAETVAKELRKSPQLIVIAKRAVGGAEAMVRQGRAVVGIEVPELRSFANPFVKSKPLRIVVDASRGSLGAAAAARIEAAYWRAVADRADAAESGPGLVTERLYNPQGRADWTFLPGLIGVTVMIAMIMLGTLSLAREREGGTWEALLILPVRRIEALLGKLLPYVLIGTVQGCAVLAVGAVLFDLPARGSIAALILLLPLFAAAHLALGYAIAARARTQLAALQGAVAFYLPAMLLSGFLYPFETLPRWAQILGNGFPLTHFIRAASGVMLRGEGWSGVAGHAAPIAAFLAVATLIAVTFQARATD
jgi:ABC-2 type transport system permease protein